MAQRSSSKILALAFCAAALSLVCTFSLPAFVAPPAPAKVVVPAEYNQATKAAVLSAVLAAPEMAHAANQGYAILQVGWAVFIIGLGPAVLFWIYFNKPEIL